jgi:chromate transporter
MKKKSEVILDLFITFMKIGAFTIGGGLAMLPVIEREIVDRKGYISQEEIVDAFAASQSLPGIVAINSSIYIGYRIAGFMGALVSAIGVVLPSFVVILAIAMLFTTVSGNEYVNRALTGVKAGVAGLIAVTIVRMGRRVIRDIFGLVLAIGAFVLVTWFGVSIVLAIGAGALLGFLIYFVGRVRRNDPD